jgi:predicted nucleotidyltransferase
VSVKFFRLNKNEVRRKLQAYADMISADPTVVGVVLFGSHARQQATAQSDADVLILLSESAQPFHERIPDYLRHGVGLSLDIFPYTLEEAQ